MPPEDFRCRPLRFLLREVIVRRLIVPLLDHFSDPNEINQLLVWLLSEVSPRPDDFVSCLDNSRSVDELESVLKSILEEKARTLDSADGSLVQLPIHVVLTNSVAVSFFIDYLQTVGGQNYIDLYLAIEGFKVSVEHQLRSLANGESIDGDVYETIKEAAHFMYQQYLSQEVVEVLRDDEHFYPAFKRSRLYAKMLAELGIIGDDERPETPISESSAYSGASEGKIHDNKVVHMNTFLEGSVLNDGEPTMSAIVETLGIGQQASGKQSFVLYNVRVNRSVNGKKISGWNVLRRYSDFHTLHTFVIQKALNLFMECILQPSLLKFYPDLSKILFDFLSQKEYLGNREPITRKVMSAMFDPIRLGVKAVGTTVKAVPDQVCTMLITIFKYSHYLLLVVYKSSGLKRYLHSYIRRVLDLIAFDNLLHPKTAYIAAETLFIFLRLEMRTIGDTMSVEDIIKSTLGVHMLETLGGPAAGSISEGQGFNSENGRLFLKKNSRKGASTMFKGEAVSLHHILETGAISAPKPLKTNITCAVKMHHRYSDHGWGLVTTFININCEREDMNIFGKRLANMHKHNENLLLSTEKASGFVGRVSHIHENDGGEEDQVKYGTNKFGFEVTTCCGFFPQENDWCNEWASFFITNRLQPLIDQLIYVGLYTSWKGERDLRELWPHLMIKGTALLSECQNVVPALVHGDLWSGNWVFSQAEPVIFDPASFFADPEFEQGIMNMFGGNHFGSSYKSSSMSLIYKILDMQQNIRSEFHRNHIENTSFLFDKKNSFFYNSIMQDFP
uniref:protein-ribulosamine 3-kinase n=1 Tax=Heterorhabditis bacteriophora TaxID=37862 RepID=A0A1I7WCX5_HETBA